MDNTFLTPLQLCPNCSTKLDAATNVEGEDAPKPGDFTVCIRCRMVLRFDYSMHVYLPTRDEWRELTPEKFGLIGRIQRALVTMRAERN